MTTASIVICTHDQSARLRLVLRALSVQTVTPLEVIVVDDASTDATPALAEEARRWFSSASVRFERLASNSGSAAARNAGARLAGGEVLVFLDSDALPAKSHVERHLAAHQDGPAAVIGPLWHTTTTEFLADPSTGALMEVPIPRERRSRIEADRAGHCITEDDVLHRFDSIVARSARGTYPHLGFQEELAEAIQARLAQGHSAAWVLMTPQNFSVARGVFEDAGGFDETLPFAEGWDLALTLIERGVAFRREARAPIYHLYHHHPFGDFGQGLRRWRALTTIADKHRRQALLLTLLFFRYHQGDPLLPEEVGPMDLDHLGALFDRFPGDDLGDYQALLRGHPYFQELAEAAAPKPSRAAMEVVSCG